MIELRRFTGSEKLIAALLVTTALAGSCTQTRSGDNRVPADNSFLEITDCLELERLATIEVDRINAADSQASIDQATARFQSIVAQRDKVC